MAGAGAAQTNALWPLLAAGHYDVRLGAEDAERLMTWMDTYGQLRGSFDSNQEEELKRLRQRLLSAAAAP